MKYATMQSVTCRGCGDIEIVSSVDVTVFPGSQNMSVTQQSLGRMTAEPEQDYVARLPARMGRHSRSTNRSLKSIPSPYIMHLSVNVTASVHTHDHAHARTHTHSE